MTQAFKFIVDLFWKVFDMIDQTVVFEFFDFEVSILDVFIAFIIIGFVTSVFWKGVKS